MKAAVEESQGKGIIHAINSKQISVQLDRQAVIFQTIHRSGCLTIGLLRLTHEYKLSTVSVLCVPQSLAKTKRCATGIALSRNDRFDSLERSNTPSRFNHFRCFFRPPRFP